MSPFSYLRRGPTPAACHRSLTLAALIRSDFPLSQRPLGRSRHPAACHRSLTLAAMLCCDESDFHFGVEIPEKNGGNGSSQTEQRRKQRTNGEERFDGVAKRRTRTNRLENHEHLESGFVRGFRSDPSASAGLLRRPAVEPPPFLLRSSVPPFVEPLSPPSLFPSMGRYSKPQSVPSQSVRLTER